MELDGHEIQSDEDESSKETLNAKLSTYVAIAVVLVATFMGLCKIKEQKVTARMTHELASYIDGWSYYQAKSTQQKLFESAADLADYISASRPRAAVDFKPQTAWRAHAKKEAATQSKASAAAKEAEAKYESLEGLMQEFDVSEALLALSLALLAVASLARRFALFWIGLAPAAIGVILGLSWLFTSI